VLHLRASIPRRFHFKRLASFADARLTSQESSLSSVASALLSPSFKENLNPDKCHHMSKFNPFRV